MSAYFETGFSVRQPAWHGLATVLDEYPGSWDEARTLAGLDWEPVMVPSFRFEGSHWRTGTVHQPTEGARGEFVQDEGFSRVVRSDTGATLAHAKDSYSIISHADMGGIVEAVLDQPNVKYETAGVLEGGRSVWALAYLDEPMTLPGDSSLTVPYVAIMNRHDGSGACRVQATNVRIICANTYKLAEVEGDRTGASYSFRHTTNWRDHVEDAKAAIQGVRSEVEAYRKLATDLLDIRLTPAQVNRFVVEFIPAPPEMLISDRVAHNVEAARVAVREILAGPTVEGAGIGGTGYGLVQAAGEYLDHLRNYRNKGTYLNRTLLRTEPLKSKAVALVREVAKSS